MRTVLYIACSQERIQMVSDVLAAFPTIEPICYAADGLEALTLAGILKPHVVLLDAQLEKISGADVARNLSAKTLSVNKLSTDKTIQTIIVLDEMLDSAALTQYFEEITTEYLS